MALITALIGSLLLAGLQSPYAAKLENWEGPHIDVLTTNTAIDWWYVQLISQTAAKNGIPPSIEIVLKHGNTFQLGTSNTPLYSVEVHGFDNDGQRFAQTLVFNTSTVTSTPTGVTRGVWGNNEVTFTAPGDGKTFKINFLTTFITGTITINRASPSLNGCGGSKASGSPFFNELVSDGRTLTPAEENLYKKTGWRITSFDGDSRVSAIIGQKPVVFNGPGYKDSNWSPRAMNHFISSWYVMIAVVGPYSFVTFTGQPTTGKNVINSGHILKNGHLISSQCNIVGERQTDVSLIRPSGEVLDSGVVAPTAFGLTFVLKDGQKISFNATNLAVNPSVSLYHRWIAKYVGGVEGDKKYTGYGITEWLNGGNNSHWSVL